MRISIHENYLALSKWVAHYVAKKINDFKPTKDRPFVLGLPTGSSPIGTYKELVNLHKEGKMAKPYQVRDVKRAMEKLEAQHE